MRMKNSQKRNGKAHDEAAGKEADVTAKLNLAGRRLGKEAAGAGPRRATGGVRRKPEDVERRLVMWRPGDPLTADFLSHIPPADLPRIKSLKEKIRKLVKLLKDPNCTLEVVWNESEKRARVGIDLSNMNRLVVDFLAEPSRR